MKETINFKIVIILGISLFCFFNCLGQINSNKEFESQFLNGKTLLEKEAFQEAEIVLEKVYLYSKKRDVKDGKYAYSYAQVLANNNKQLTE